MPNIFMNRGQIESKFTVECSVAKLYFQLLSTRYVNFTINIDFVRLYVVLLYICSV